MRKLFLQPLPTINLGKFAKPSLVFALLFISFSTFAQVDLADGQAAIEEAATGIEDYFDPIRNLVVRLVIL